MGKQTEGRLHQFRPLGFPQSTMNHWDTTQQQMEAIHQIVPDSREMLCKAQKQMEWRYSKDHKLLITGQSTIAKAQNFQCKIQRSHRFCLLPRRQTCLNPVCLSGRAQRIRGRTTASEARDPTPAHWKATSLLLWTTLKCAYVICASLNDSIVERSLLSSRNPRSKDSANA